MLVGAKTSDSIIASEQAGAHEPPPQWITTS
jgi:hypothetical protein